MDKEFKLNHLKEYGITDLNFKLSDFYEGYNLDTKVGDLI